MKETRGNDFIIWTNRMNSAIDYIEENLTNNIDMEIVASKAYCSEYNFTRIFSFIVGIPLSEYIRNRRLTMAGFMLTRSNATVLEIAQIFGYSSPNSFTRAFASYHGVVPSNARDVSVQLQTYPRLSFNLTKKPCEELSYRIIEEGSTEFFGVSLTTKRYESSFTVPAFFDDCEEKGLTNKIVEAGHGNEKTLLNSIICDIDDENIKYMICLPIPYGGVLDEFEKVIVPSHLWAVFSMIIDNPSEESIVKLWELIWSKWLLNCDYELDTCPRQERCYWSDNGKMIVEAWVPIIKK